MKHRHTFGRALAAALALAAVAAGALLGGCSGSGMSNREVAAIKQGPPKEMPPQARQMMQKSNQRGPQSGGAPNAGR